MRSSDVLYDTAFDMRERLFLERKRVWSVEDNRSERRLSVSAYSKRTSRLAHGLSWKLTEPLLISQLIAEAAYGYD